MLVSLYNLGIIVDMTVYLINRRAIHTLDCNITEGIWFNKNVNDSFLKVFGFIAFAHEEHEISKKLNFKSRKCAFIEYDRDDHDYRL